MAIRKLTPRAGLTPGDTRFLKAVFVAVGGGPARVDRSNVTLTVQAPSGDTETYSGDDLTDEGDGVISKGVRFDEPGRWRGTWQWNGDGDSENEEWVVAVTESKLD